eukprot:c8434_g1_i1.p1 GENE.c8434_g1_i1~~c8434_g1_i1.p1  ORF type:complete len:807 (-),score=232.52 c8434_g1_i1:83-2503(-)
MQIKYVVNEFGPAFLSTFNYVIGEVTKAVTVNAQSQTLPSITLVFSAALLASKVLHDLVYQDLPEFFEDHLKEFMEGCHALLTAEHPLLLIARDNNSVLVELRASVCDILNLFLEKYDEEFGPYLGTLLHDVWGLLIKCGPQPYFDPLIITASHFLTSVITGPSHKMMQDSAVLKDICEKIVIPNIQLREADEEMFEGDPEEFIRLDIEGSDMDTRRRAAHDLVKGLTKYFEGPTTAVFTQYISSVLQQSFTNEVELCRAKDACMHLVTAITAKETTGAAGATQTNQLVNILDFFRTQVIPELKSPVDQRPILKAASLKFAATFRSQLSQQMSADIMQSSITLLKSESEVVHTYAAYLVEKMLSMKDPSTKKPFFDRTVVKTFSGPLLSELFGVFERTQEENDYIIKAVLRVARILQEDMIAHAEFCIGQLQNMVTKVCNNPSKPVFNHYLFESIACLVKYIVKTQPATATSFEGILFPSFQTILTNDVADFIPYVLQILTLLVEVRPKPCPPVYIGLLPPFLNVVMYERPANVPPLAGLLIAYLRHNSSDILAHNQLQPILGVFQFLISKKPHDHDGLKLLTAVFDFIELQRLLQFFPTILQILLNRLQHMPTAKFERNLCLTLLSFCAKHGGASLIESLEKIQAGLSAQLIGHVINRHLSQIGSEDSRRIASVGAVQLLCDTPAMLSLAPNAALWPNLLEELIKLLESNHQAAEEDDEAEMAAIEAAAVGGQTANSYSKLLFAAVPQAEPFATLPNSKEYLARKLSALSQARPNQLGPLIAAKAQPTTTAALNGYLSALGLPLS